VSAKKLRLTLNIAQKSWSLNVGDMDTWGQFHQRFYVQTFHTNVISAAFSSYVLGLAKNSYKKCAHKMLMKLTAGNTISPCRL
jgi:hypothetical protein